MIETIDVIHSISSGKVIIETDEGSTIMVTNADGIHLEGFLGYTKEQKKSWDLHQSTFGQRKHFICLVIPHVTMPGAAWIPLACCGSEDTATVEILPQLVLTIRSILERVLPDDQFDQW